MNRSSKLALLGLSISLAACSALESDKINYKSSAKAPSLEVPPDLTQLTRDTRYTVPGSTVTASGYQQQGQSGPAVPLAAASVSDVRIERAGSQRWLVVARPADKLWDTVKDFWQENGFVLVTAQAELGIMETEWAENRAKIPQDFIRKALGKVLDSLYDTGERDKFRTRLERNATGGTEIYISHRGMAEVYSNTDKTQTVWQPRPADPELEAEFLRRLMVKLGVTQEQSAALVAAGVAPQGARLDKLNGQPVVLISDNFDRAWRRVGLSLDRTGFTVEDRDRSQGTYFVRYVEPAKKEDEPGFFSKLFSGAPKAPSGPQKYRISIKSQGEASTVSVLTAGGETETSDNAQRILKVLADDLK